MRKAKAIKPKIIVLFADCHHSRAFGDFVQCAQIGYELQQITGIPVTLLTRTNSMLRFDILYKIDDQKQHAIYGDSISIATTEQFDSAQYEICGYVDVSCKPNDKAVVENYILENNCKGVLVGTANTGDDYDITCRMRLGYDQLIKEQKINVVMAGFGGKGRSGITYTPYSIIEQNISENALKLPPLVEAIISTQKLHFGLIYIQQTLNPNDDKNYAQGYFQHFFKHFGTTLLVLNNHAVAIQAAIGFCKKNGAKIRLVDEANRRVILIDQKGKAIIIDRNSNLACETANQIASKLQANRQVNSIILCNPLTNVKMRRLLNNSAAFVGLCGVSSIIEGFGEGKLIYAQYVPTNIIFIRNYLSEIISLISNKPEVCTFAQVLFAKKPLLEFQEKMLTTYLEDVEFCCALQECCAKIIEKYAGSLTKNILKKLGIFAESNKIQNISANQQHQAEMPNISDYFKSS